MPAQSCTIRIFTVKCGYLNTLSLSNLSEQVGQLSQINRTAALAKI